MASFPIQAQQYDGATVEATIADMEQELADETSLRSTLDATTGDKILAAQKFREDNELEADDAEYQALITSEPYQKLADDIASLQAISSSLADFLVAKGRRGRPPLN